MKFDDEWKDALIKDAITELFLKKREIIIHKLVDSIDELVGDDAERIDLNYSISFDRNTVELARIVIDKVLKECRND